MSSSCWALSPVGGAGREAPFLRRNVPFLLENGTFSSRDTGPYFFMFFISLVSKKGGVKAALMNTLKAQSEEDSEEWLRQMALPEEYLIAHCPMAVGGCYRRFESENVLDLVRIRRQREKRQAQG
jgi:hypothetical protein